MAVLCHEHAKTNKLPYLDKEASIQGRLEAEADEVIKKTLEKKKKKKAQPIGLEDDEWHDNNQYLPGVNPSFVVSHQEELLHLASKGALDKVEEDEDYEGDELDFGCFCLPCDIRDEVSWKCNLFPFYVNVTSTQLILSWASNHFQVYAKPPSYSHVVSPFMLIDTLCYIQSNIVIIPFQNTNKYDPQNRPKRQPPSGETCECKSLKPSRSSNDKEKPIACGDNCMNRMFGIECVGDSSRKNGTKNPYWNCNCGTSCGNRRVTNREFAKCRPKREEGRGWGVVAVNPIKEGDLVQEYVGEIISEAEKRKRLDDWARDHPNDPNFYIMHLQTGWYIDAREKGNLSRFINHSCDPNCKIIPINVAGHIRMAIFASKKIRPGEFLSYDYRFDTKDGDKFQCRCGAKNCRGTMKGGKADTTAAEEEPTSQKKKTKKQIREEVKAQYEKDKKYLEDVRKSKLERFSQVGVYVPGEKEGGVNNTTVASGPRDSWKKDVRDTRVCLWRNVMKGSNFYSRNEKLHPEYQMEKIQDFLERKNEKHQRVDVLGELFSMKA